MPRALITGGAGFIGYHLASGLLMRGYDVHLVDNFARGVRDSDLERLLADARVSLIDCDLAKSGSLDAQGREYDLIFHLAALVGVPNVVRQPYDVLVRNMAMLAHMIAFAQRQKKLERFVFASTSEIYAGTLAYYGMEIPTPEATPLTVSDVAQPRSTYMLSKLYGEAMCHHSGLPYTIVRPHNVYGPRMGVVHVIPELLKKAWEAPEGGKLEVFSVDHRRTFCYVSDAVELIIRLAEADDAVGAVVNVGREAPEVAISEVAKIVLRTVGRLLDIEPKPPTDGSPPRRAPDMSETERLVGYRAEVGLDEGVKKTYEWYSAKVFEGGEASAR